MIKFNIKNCRIKVSFWFFAALSILSLFDKSGMGVCALLAALIHESGHLLMMYYIVKNPPRSVSITPAGIIIEADELGNGKGWAAVALSGSIANFIFAFVMFFFIFNFRFSIFNLLSANLFIGLINLIPAKGLDGGEILFRILIRRMKIRHAELVSMVVSLLCAVPAIAAGLYIMSQNPGNFTLLTVGLWLIAGMIREYV